MGCWKDIELPGIGESANKGQYGTSDGARLGLILSWPCAEHSISHRTCKLHFNCLALLLVPNCPLRVH